MGESKSDVRARIRQHPDGAKILDAVEKAMAEGWSMQERLGLVHYEDKLCCPLSTLGISKRLRTFFEAGEILGWGDGRSSQFARGFDGLLFESSEAFELGRLFRALLVEATS